MVCTILEWSQFPKRAEHNQAAILDVELVVHMKGQLFFHKFIVHLINRCLSCAWQPPSD